MPAIFLVSDTHLGHAGVCKFLRDDGTKLRPWDAPEEMDEEMVKRWNETVRPKDKVYHLNGKRIVFNGNGYAEAWVKEAKKRGLSDLKDTVSTLPALVSDESIELFDKQKVMTKEELQSRFTIYSETYAKEINIEANVMIQMCRSQIFPASNEHALNLAKSINQCKEAIAESEALLLPQKRNLKIILENLKGLKQKELELEKILDDASNIADSYDKAKFYKDKVVSKMKELRIFADELERLVDKKAWPFPTYEDLLFRL